MTAIYTFDVFSSLDGFGAAGGDWTGYWGKQGPELLDHRLALYEEEQRMVFGADTYRAFARMLASSTEGSDVRDPWVTRMRSLPTTVVSTTLEGPLDWPDATLELRRDRPDDFRADTADDGPPPGLPPSSGAGVPPQGRPPGSGMVHGLLRTVGLPTPQPHDRHAQQNGEDHQDRH
ncbi:hypothetical protein [Streptomyces luteogriseus]|uniref:hypothetical protein n=1 Tax=Streptomyces luteogriseus TaxID=68233 RepID=UPI0037AE28ED